jgi:hypothetical protein
VTFQTNNAAFQACSASFQVCNVTFQACSEAFQACCETLQACGKSFEKTTGVPFSCSGMFAAEHARGVCGSAGEKSAEQRKLGRKELRLLSFHILDMNLLSLQSDY